MSAAGLVLRNLAESPVQILIGPETPGPLAFGGSGSILGATVVVLASVIAAAGMVAHNALEFGPAFLLDPETLIPLAIFGLFALLAWAGPANAGVHSALLAWALLNLVGGGILSVSPKRDDATASRRAGTAALADIPAVRTAPAGRPDRS